jgi:hypothetical protein
VVSVLYWQEPLDVQHINDRMSLVFFIITLWAVFPAFGSLVVCKFCSLFLRFSFRCCILFALLCSFGVPRERSVVKKERASSYYRVSTYFVGKSCAEMLNLAYPSLFIVIIYWCTGLNNNFGRFLGFWLVILLVILSSESIGMIVSTLTPDCMV